MEYYTLDYYQDQYQKEYDEAKSENLLNQFVDSCDYRFTEGKHIGGCGHGKAPKGTDKKGGCEINIDNNECPRMPIAESG